MILPPLARSSDEAHLYMELRPCRCGAANFGAASSVTETPNGWIVRYAGSCADCGRDRCFEFRQPDEPTVPAEDVWAAGDQPSELLDAGEWLWVADTYGSIPADTEGLSSDGLDQLRTDLLAAGAAVGEVLKFLPEGAAEVPDEAFWSERGRQVRAVEPGRFGRLRLIAAWEAYRRAVGLVESRLTGLGGRLRGPLLR